MKQETYLPGYTPNASEFMARRTAQSHAGFLLPKLHSGLRLLDCGCGPGTITLGLAALVEPANVVGLDRENSQIQLARQAAESQGIANVHFDAGSIYELPFADGAFDVVFAHAVFEHLRDPMTALSEIRRVLTRGGLIALRSPDWGGFLLAPESDELLAAISCYQELQVQSGGDVHAGRKLKAWLRQAGFNALEFSASYECYASLESIGEYLAQRLNRSAQEISDRARQQTLQRHAVTLRDWYHDPDAIFAQCWCEITGIK